MKTRTLIAMALATGTLLAAQANARVYVDRDETSDFSTYQTYSWTEGTAADDQLAEQRIRKAVDRELAAQGLQRVDQGGDLLVATHAAARTQTRVDVETLPSYYGYYWRRPFWHGHQTADVREIEVGTLIVDLLDATQERLVWRGKATGTIRSNPEKNTKRLNKAVAKMFDRYPAGR